MAATAKAAPIIWPRGDSFVLNITITTGAGAAYDLTGALVAWTLKQDINQADADATFRKSSGVEGGITITSATGGTCRLELTDDQMATLTPDLDYVWDVQVQAADGTTSTPIRGTLKVEADVRQGQAT